jgi:hypothetical protein
MKVKVVKMKPKRRRRAIERRMPKALREKYFALSRSFLDKAEAVFQDCRELDTAVSDVAAEGIAYLLWVAFDCAAVANNLDVDQWKVYSEEQIFQWFVDHGYAPWFCLGATSLFRKSRPPICGGIRWMMERPSHKQKDAESDGQADVA